MYRLIRELLLINRFVFVELNLFLHLLFCLLVVFRLYLTGLCIRTEIEVERWSFKKIAFLTILSLSHSLVAAIGSTRRRRQHWA